MSSEDADKKEPMNKISKDSLIYDKSRSDTPTNEELKNLSKHDKFMYFKEYYLPYILIGLVIIAGLTWGFFSLSDMNKKKDAFYCGMMEGVQFESNIQESMPETFSTYLSEKTDYDGYIDKNRTFFEVYYATYTDDIKMNGNYDKKRFDVFITRNGLFEIYASNGHIYDLSEVLTKDLLEQLSDKLVYVSLDGGEQIPYGILLDDIKYDFYDGSGKPVAPPILSIPQNTKRLKAAIQFIEFITQE